MQALARAGTAARNRSLNGARTLVVVVGAPGRSRVGTLSSMRSRFPTRICVPRTLSPGTEIRFHRLQQANRELVPMWTLILVTFVVSGISTGSVGTTTAFLDFPSAAKCQAAADVLAGADQINPSRGNHPNISPSAIYRIVAHCVER